MSYRFSLSGNDELKALMSTTRFALAPIASFSTGSFDNTANNAFQKETLSQKNYSVGLRFYINSFFIQGHHSWVDMVDVGSGLLNMRISDHSKGWGGALGFDFPVSSSLYIELSGNVDGAAFQAKTEGFSTKTELIQYGGFLGLNFSFFPSPPKKKLTF